MNKTQIKDTAAIIIGTVVMVLGILILHQIGTIHG